VANFEEVKKSVLDEVVTMVTMEEIPPELVMNWAQTGMKIVPSSRWTMEQCGAKRVEMIGVDDKRQITAVFCGTFVGDFLPVQLIYAGTTTRCHPKFNFPPGWHITHSKKHWSNEETMIQYIENIILPYVEAMRQNLEDEDAAALVIMDNFKGQITEKINTILEHNKIHVCLLPANTTDLLQPMDLSVNKPAKDFLRRRFEEWYSEKVMEQVGEQGDIDSEITPTSMSMPILKEAGAKWFVEMADHLSSNPQFIINGFIKAGIAGALDDTVEEIAVESEVNMDSSSEDSDDNESDNGSSEETTVHLINTK